MPPAVVPPNSQLIAAVVFDLDGVLIDSEPVWEAVRREFVEAQGGRWPADAQTRMMGMSTREWSSYVGRELGVGLPPEEVARAVMNGVRGQYEKRLPLMEGAIEAVSGLAAVWPLGLASSSPGELIEVVLDRAALRPFFKVVLSTEEVARGKPAPDVYVEVMRRLLVEPARSVAVEDSTNGIRSAAAAGLRVIAIPQPRYPPDPGALALASRVLPDLRGLTPQSVVETKMA
jgi:beta-phosphoglucomutase-like phosphatase (HAD superfamily)